jgi:hypothetical protein
MILSPYFYLHLTIIICSIGLIIASLEIIWAKEDYSSRGILSWKILRLRSYLFKIPFLLHVSDFVFGERGFLFLIKLRILTLLILIYCIITDIDFRIPLTIIVITILSSNFRSTFGCDGSDQMVTIVFISSWVASLTGVKSLYSSAALFVGCQASLSYAVSGVTKIFGEYWRHGTAVREILDNQTYGNRKIVLLLKHNLWVTRFLTFGTIILESLFPLSLFLSNNFLLIVLSLGVCFHASIALVMGLNTFFWAFTSTYPCLFYTSQVLKDLL